MRPHERRGSARHGQARRGSAWHGKAWLGKARHGMDRRGMARLGAARLGKAGEPMRPIVPTSQLSRRIPTAGRLRFGIKTSKAMRAIDTWRLTSEDEEAIRQVAAIYGGTPRPWKDAPTEGQHEVITEAAELRVVLPPDPLGGSPVYELWSRGGCQRRCNGETCTTVVSGPDGGEPADIDCICAAKGEMACDVKTRLSVILPEVKFAGVWRLDTGSWAAARELPGMVELVQAVQQNGLARGLLALEHRKQVSNGQTKKFIVPTLRVDATADELASGQASVAYLAPGEADAIEAGTEVVGEIADDQAGEGSPTPPRVAEAQEGVTPKGATTRATPPADPALPVEDVPRYAVSRHDRDRGRVSYTERAPRDPNGEAVLDEQEVRKVAMACNDVAHHFDVNGDQFRHDLIDLLTDGRTESAKEITPSEKRKLKTVLSLFRNGTLSVAEALGPDDRLIFLTKEGEVVDNLHFDGPRPQVAPVPPSGASQPAANGPPSSIDWKDLARQCGLTQGRVLILAREIAERNGWRLPLSLNGIEPDSELEAALLQEVGRT